MHPTGREGMAPRRFTDDAINEGRLLRRSILRLRASVMGGGTPEEAALDRALMFPHELSETAV
jgi:hypothetical protein